MTDRPVFTVVVPAYNARGRIVPTLRALAAQDFDEPWEAVIVDTGDVSCAEDLARELPSARHIRRPERLRVAAARNAGVREARGEFVAFCADDCLPVPGWLKARAEVHRAGFDLVGGSITNANPESAVATAGYLLEYAALLPIADLLAQQSIPHSLSFHRSVFERVGHYDEDTLTGEDTLLNRRCLAAGLEVGFAPGAAMAHGSPTTLRPMLRHARDHGRGLAQCADRHDMPHPLGPRGQFVGAAVLRALVLYPARGLVWKVRLLRARAPQVLPSFLRLSPLIGAGYLAAGWGALRERQRAS